MEKGQIHFNVEGYKGVTETWNIVQHEVRPGADPINKIFTLGWNGPCREAKNGNMTYLIGPL